MAGECDGWAWIVTVLAEEYRRQPAASREAIAATLLNRCGYAIVDPPHGATPDARIALTHRILGLADA